MALAGYKALVKEQSSATTFTDEATTTADDTTYQITSTSKRIWDFDTALVVEDDGSTTTETYTFNKLDGTVTFESSDSERVITVTGKYVALTTVVEAKAFSFDGTCDMLDKTVFQDEAREYAAGLLSAQITIGKFFSVDEYYVDMWDNKTIKVVEFNADSDDTDGVFRVFARVSGDNVSSSIEGLVEEGITLQCTNKMIAEA